MCLILLALGSHPDYPLVVAANRDEFYDRPATFWSDSPDVLAGRDLKAGGTWLGIDRAGRFGAVTNYRQGERELVAPRSRGHLVSDYLATAIDAETHLQRVEREAELYNGFNLILGDARELFYYSNREGSRRRLGPGVYGLSNHLLDTPWPKVTSGKNALSALLGSGPELIPDLLALLSDRSQASDDSLPETGVSLAWERLLSAAFIMSPSYGTRSSTVLLVGRDGAVVMVERSFAGGGAPTGEVRHQFQIERMGSTGRR
jgi:uncharacterized protein with NRDE domain